MARSRKPRLRMQARHKRMPRKKMAATPESPSKLLSFGEIVHELRQISVLVAMAKMEVWSLPKPSGLLKEAVMRLDFVEREIDELASGGGGKDGQIR